MPPVAAEFAVGDRFQPDRLLPLDRLADRRILDLPQRFDGTLAALRLVARLAQLRRPQQAADLVGAKRRFHFFFFAAVPFAGDLRSPSGFSTKS